MIIYNTFSRVFPSSSHTIECSPSSSPTVHLSRVFPNLFIISILSCDISKVIEISTLKRNIHPQTPTMSFSSRRHGSRTCFSPTTSSLSSPTSGTYWSSSGSCWCQLVDMYNGLQRKYFLTSKYLSQLTTISTPSMEQ